MLRSGSRGRVSVEEGDGKTGGDAGVDDGVVTCPAESSLKTEGEEEEGRGNVRSFFQKLTEGREGSEREMRRTRKEDAG